MAFAWYPFTALGGFVESHLGGPAYGGITAKSRRAQRVAKTTSVDGTHGLKGIRCSNCFFANLCGLCVFAVNGTSHEGRVAGQTTLSLR